MPKTNSNIIYEATIDILLANVPNEDKEMLNRSYQEYLVESYDDLEIMKHTMISYIKSETEKWVNMPLEHKKAYLVRDEKFLELSRLSETARTFAQARIKTGIMITVEEATDVIMKMKNLFEQIESFNKDLAKQYLSEGTVDCDYASGQSENISIRLSNDYQMYKAGSSI